MKYKIASIILGVILLVSNSPVAHAETLAQDTAAPTLAAITPAAGTAVTVGTIRLRAQGVEDPSGVGAVSFVIQKPDGTPSLTYLATNTSGSDWEAVLSTTDLGQPGTYKINAVGTDALGNQGDMGSTTVTLSGDAASPVLQSVTPQSGTVMDLDAKEFTVQANVSDASGVKAVSFTAYNNADGEAGSVSLGAVPGQDGSWSQDFSLDSFGNKAGTYTIEIWAMDTLGNTNKIGSTQLVVRDPSQVTDTSKADAFINAAMAQLGKTYVLGGKGPTVFDCSGLVYYALNASGYKISYMTSAQWALSGYQRINSMSDLQRGDVICFKGHVGIYLGNGSMVNASFSHHSVVISNNIQGSSYWQSNFLCGRRLF